MTNGDESFARTILFCQRRYFRWKIEPCVRTAPHPACTSVAIKNLLAFLIWLWLLLPAERLLPEHTPAH